jgi:hypothetical protein
MQMLTDGETRKKKVSSPFKSQTNLQKQWNCDESTCKTTQFERGVDVLVLLESTSSWNKISGIPMSGVMHEGYKERSAKENDGVGIKISR